MKKLLLLLLVLPFICYADVPRPVMVNKSNYAVQPLYALQAEFCIAMSDETTNLTSGTKVVWRAPYNFKITDIRAGVKDSSSANKVTVDIFNGPLSILSTPLTIDVGENTSRSAEVWYSLAANGDTVHDDDQISMAILAPAPTNAKGLKVWILGHRF